MSKNNPIKPNNDKELEALSFTLQRQDDQSKALQKVINTVMDTKDEMVEMRDETRKDIQELRDSITLNRQETREIQSVAGKQAKYLTNELFRGLDVSNDLFSAKMGHFRRAVYKRLKDTFDIAVYYEVRRTDFNDARTLIRGIELTSLDKYQRRLTMRQKEIAAFNNDDITGLE